MALLVSLEPTTSRLIGGSANHCATDTGGLNGAAGLNHLMNNVTANVVQQVELTLCESCPAFVKNVFLRFPLTGFHARQNEDQGEHHVEPETRQHLEGLQQTLKL